MPEIENPIGVEKKEDTQKETTIYLGPVQITEEDNEWNKRALKIAARELRIVPSVAALAE